MIAAALRNEAEEEKNPIRSGESQPSSSPPFVSIEGVANFRDLGHYPCQPPSSSTGERDYSHGQERSYIVRSGTLFRSAQLTAITSRGSDALSQKHRVRRVYDLRSEREVSNHKAATNIEAREDNDESRTGGNGNSTIQLIACPVFPDQDFSPAALAEKYQNYTSAHEAIAAKTGAAYSPGFVNAYREILLSAGPAYRSIFLHIRDRNINDDLDAMAGSETTAPEPLLFHCAAGKDRTGVFAALVLRLCGVADEVIAWDYSLTHPGLGRYREVIISGMMNTSKKMAAGDDSTTTPPLPTLTREQAERAVGCKSGNMTVFLNEVLDGDDVGGVEGYMQRFCGLTEPDIDLIRQRLIVPGTSVFGDGTGYWR